ncbi:MAG: MiaB/RimO family radical SAM methylthiotransferase [Coriobacteriales bacterium]|nr:MiaB/RimO family radical SAM methylthiotransferase [Coriobacteriales bacterium]
MTAPAARIGVTFKTLGCKVNQVESEDIAAELLGRGAQLVSEADAAVVIVNTCTVTGEADAKARKAVRHAIKGPGSPIVVVTGCLAAIDAEGLAALGDRVVVEADKGLIAPRVAELLGVAADQIAVPPRVGNGFRTRAQLKIEDGCDAYCTYCIVPYARGVPRSTPLDEILAETERLVEAGAREIVLTGINVGRYRDEARSGPGAADLAAVIEAVAATGVERLRLSSVEPLDLSERLLAVLSATPAFCEHLHVPLQSADDEVLCAMGRGYTAEQYAERIAAAREALPGVAVTTDVIAGFPGETDAQADATLHFCDEIGFARLHVFRFSSRVGTPAGSMRAVDPHVRAGRAAALRALDRRLRQRHAESRLGQTADVLVERVSVAEGARLVQGTTRDYLQVRAGDASSSVGEILTVRLERYRDGIVEGVAEQPEAPVFRDTPEQGKHVPRW